MEKFLMLIISLTVIQDNPLYIKSSPPTSKVLVETKVKETVVEPEIDSTDILIKSLIFVESSGRDSVINYSTNAGGCLQIRPIMIKDVNRILSKKNIKKKFTIQDRFNRSKAIQMFKIWKDHYHKKSSFEKIARCWNGGTKGHKIKATIKYWEKVKRNYDR